MRLRSPITILLVLIGCSGAPACEAASCVWKVTAANGQTLFLGGSVHALRSSDYPLPASFNRAFDACSRLAFETDLASSEIASKDLLKAGKYAKGDSLKNHVDPRTYSYVKRFFALQNIPEETFKSYRPWLIAMMLESPPTENSQLGVEQFLKQRAQASHKPITGLESVREHISPFVDLNDRDGEAVLLIHFINLGQTSPNSVNIVDSWRHGDTDALLRVMRDAFQDFPPFLDRIVTARNRRWIPKIEGFINSGETYFVVAGAAHMGGSSGVVALLRARGYKVDQW